MKQIMTFKAALCALLLAAGLMLAAKPVPAQMYYSLRSQALNTDFAGIIEDDLTDIFLNPARAGLIDRREVTAARFPDRSISIPFPTSSSVSRYSNTNLTPDEDSYRLFRISPVALGFLGLIGGSLRTAIGVEVAHSNSDELTGNPVLTINSNQVVQNDTNSRVYKSGADHAALNLALALPVGESYAGLRFVAAYDGEEARRIDDRTTYRMPAAAPNEVYFSQDYWLTDYRFQTTAFACETGLFRPEHLFSDLALRVDWRRSLYPVSLSDSYYENNDYDNNGSAYDGGLVRLYYDDVAYESNRDYHELTLQGRAHLDLGSGIRAVQVVTWSHGEGNGSVLFSSLYDRRESVNELLENDLAFRYDGDYSNIIVTSAIGRSVDIHERVRVTVGAKAIYQRFTFDEDGTGGSQTIYDRELYVDSLVIAGGYLQKHRNEETRYHLILPIALECRLHTYVSLLLNAELAGRHDDIDHSYDQAVSIDSAEVPYGDRLSAGEYNIDSSTAVYYGTGLSVNVNDRVLVDMIYSSSSIVSFTSYGYLSVRYRF